MKRKKKDEVQLEKKKKVKTSQKKASIPSFLQLRAAYLSHSIFSCNHSDKNYAILRRT